MKDSIENSWAPHPGFEPPPPAQQAGALPLDHSATFTLSVRSRKGLHHFHAPPFSKIMDPPLLVSCLELDFSHGLPIVGSWVRSQLLARTHWGLCWTAVSSHYMSACHLIAVLVPMYIYIGTYMCHSDLPWLPLLSLQHLGTYSRDFLWINAAPWLVWLQKCLISLAADECPDFY